MSRILPVTKRVGGKIKRYKNLASFNKECPSRGYGGNLCTVTNIRCTKRGEGLATVRTDPSFSTKRPPVGMWLLHFASCQVMGEHLEGRVSVAAAIRHKQPARRLGLGSARRRR